MINKLKLVNLFSIPVAFGLNACVAGNNIGSGSSGVSLNTVVNTIRNVEPVNPDIKPEVTYSCTVNPGETKFCGRGSFSIDTVTGLGFVPPVYVESQSLPLTVKIAGEAPDYRLTSTSKEVGLNSTKIVYKTLHKSYTKTQLAQAMKRSYVRSVGLNSSLKGANEFFSAYVESIPSGYGFTTDQSNYMASPGTKYDIYITNNGNKSTTLSFKPLATEPFVGTVRVVNSTKNPLTIEAIQLGNKARTTGESHIAAHAANTINIAADFSTRFSYNLFDDKTKELLCEGTIYRPVTWLYNVSKKTGFTLYVTPDGKCNSVEGSYQGFFQNEYKNFGIAENKSNQQAVVTNKLNNVEALGLLGPKIYNMISASFMGNDIIHTYDILNDGRILENGENKENLFRGWESKWNNKIIGATNRFGYEKQELDIFLNDGNYVYLFANSSGGYDVQTTLPLNRLCSLKCNLAQYQDNILTVSNAANNRKDLIFFLKDNTFVYWDSKLNQLSVPAPLEEIFGSEINKYLGQIVSIRISNLYDYSYNIMLSSGDNLFVKMIYPEGYTDKISNGISTELASYIPSIRSGFWDYKKSKISFLMHGSGAYPNTPWVVYGDQSGNWDWLTTYFPADEGWLDYNHLYDVIQNGWGTVYLKNGPHQDSDAFLFLRGKDVKWAKFINRWQYIVDMSFKLVFGTVADANYGSTRFGGVTNYYDSQDGFILFQKNNTYFLSKYKQENYSRGPYPLSFLNPRINTSFWQLDNTISVYRADTNSIVFIPRDGNYDSKYLEYRKPTVSVTFLQVADDAKQQYTYKEFNGFIVNTPRYSYLFNRNEHSFITYDQFYSNGGLSANPKSTNIKGSLWDALSKDEYGSFKAAATFDSLVIGTAYIKTAQGTRVRVFLKSDSKSKDTQSPSYLDLDPASNNQITDWKFITTTYSSAKQIMPTFESKLAFVYNIYGGKYTDFVLNDMQVVRFDNVSGTSEVKKLSELYDGASSPFLAQQLWINSADPFDDNL